MLMSIDHRLRWITIDICPIIALIADLLKHASAENWHQTMDECYAMLKPGFLGNATHMRHLLYALPCTSPAMIDICRTLAFHFLHDMLGTTPRKSDAVAVVHVEDILMADPVFAISKHTDYEHLQNVLHFVDVCLGDQSFAASNVDSTKSIIARLTSINSRIADPRGAFLERTKVKDLLLRMCMRLSFAAEASKSGGGMPKRQSTIRFK